MNGWPAVPANPLPPGSECSDNVVKRFADPQQLRIVGIDADGKTELPAQLQHRDVFGQYLADQSIDAA
jgi:hypothetical protein